MSPFSLINDFTLKHYENAFRTLNKQAFNTGCSNRHATVTSVTHNLTFKVTETQTKTFPHFMVVYRIREKLVYLITAAIRGLQSYNDKTLMQLQRQNFLSVWVMSLK